MKVRFVFVAATSAAIAASAAVALAQKTGAAHSAIAPTEIMWGAPPPSLSPGAKLAVLSGDPAAKGAFTVRLQMPAGYKIAPHWHPTDEHVTVVSGVFALGTGERFDANSVKELPAGGYAALPAQMRHFAVAKSAAVIQVHGTGPFVFNYVDATDVPNQRK